jgi:uncharacterized protein (TIGR02452 family)
MTNKEIAAHTLEILNNGFYLNSNQVRILLKNDLEFCRENTQFYSTEMLDGLLNQLIIHRKFQTEFEVMRSTTIAAIEGICADYESEKVMCLNFASAKNPGGGFFNGAEAQEESLARNSALYFSQLKEDTFYIIHRGMKSCVYTDAMIYSPGTPIIKNDAGELLPEPIYCNFVTSAAVNAGVVKRVEPELVDEIEKIMDRRIEKLLALALHKGNEVLILGAWGCGVFRNDPQMIADLFMKHLNGNYKNAFRKIYFALYTKNESMILPFEQFMSVQ